jgi:RES domain-containing protein
MIPHPESVRLAKRMQLLLGKAIPWSGEAYRSASPQYANKDDFLTGLGSQKNGGRWNPLNSFATVYLALELETALAETANHFRYYRFPISQALPRVFVGVKLHVQKLIDLTNGTVRQSLRVSRRRMLQEDWRTHQDAGQEAITQTIGRTAWENGAEGLLVPSSAKPGGRNLVYFPDNLLPDSTVALINADKLPPRP